MLNVAANYWILLYDYVYLFHIESSNNEYTPAFELGKLMKFCDIVRFLFRWCIILLLEPWCCPDS